MQFITPVHPCLTTHLVYVICGKIMYCTVHDRSNEPESCTVRYRDEWFVVAGGRGELPASRLCTFLHYCKGRTISCPMLHRTSACSLYGGSKFRPFPRYSPNLGIHRYSQVLTPNYFGTGPI